MLSEKKVVEMPVSERGPTLPRTSISWVLLVLGALAALGFGAFAFVQQTLHGFIVTGLRNPGYGSAAWGWYIAFDVFFVGVSFAGITIAAVCRLFDVAVLKPITRMAELLTITALLAGAGVVVSDLGRPLEGLLRLPRFANPSSPFYGTFTLVVAGYMFSSLVYFFLAGRADAAAVAKNPDQPGRLFYLIWASGYRDLPAHRVRHHRVSFWLALTILPLLVTAHSTLGFIFGLQSGRPGWYSALQAPGFVILAGVSGTGLLILCALGFRRLFKLHRDLPDATFHWLGNFLWILSLVYLYFMIVDELTATYSGPLADREIAHEIVGGAFAPFFWTCAGSLFLTFLIPFLLYVRGKRSVGWVAVAGVTANIAAVLKRFLIVVPSQTHGTMIPIEPPQMYTPTWIEFGVVGGLFGLMALSQLLFGRFFPLVPSPHPHDHDFRGPREVRRPVATLFAAACAIALVVVGLTDSFRLWSHGEVDPRIPFSPVIFASGVMLLFISAIVYEVFPDRRPTEREMWREHKMALMASHPRLDAGDHVDGEIHVPGRADVQQVVRLARSADDASKKDDARRTVEILDELAHLASRLSGSRR
ncbi:MAG: polysulfide reductase NrfD [Deltaproteobacteria bacterium]|nr:polysulfide reductase NrfD [Deltaproteobacteria bacterium]